MGIVHRLGQHVFFSNHFKFVIILPFEFIVKQLPLEISITYFVLNK
jgi:hypothetical protein